MKKIALGLLLFTVCFAFLFVASPVRAYAAGPGGGDGGSGSSDASSGYYVNGVFQYDKLFKPVKALDLGSWTNIFWNALVWIAFGSPLAGTFIGSALSLVILGGQGVQAFLMFLRALGIFGFFAVAVIILNHFRKLVD